MGAVLLRVEPALAPNQRFHQHGIEMPLGRDRADKLVVVSKARRAHPFESGVERVAGAKGEIPKAGGKGKQQTKDQLMQSNINYQKDLNEVAVVVAQKLAGREKEIGEGMATVYANEFTEQELKDLVAFYKSPLGKKLLASEPRAIQFSMSYMKQWAQIFSETVNGEFRAEMRKRGKEI